MPYPSLASLGTLPASSWELEFGTVPGVCVCCLPPAGAPPLTRGQEFLLLVPNKPMGKEELWEGAGSMLDVRTEWGVGREPQSGTPKAGQACRSRGRVAVAWGHIPQTLSSIPSCVQMAVLEFLDILLWIHSLVQVFIEHLLRARRCTRCWGYSHEWDREKPYPHGAYILCEDR